MRWYHRYHQSYDTAPTRSGKVGVEHFSNDRERRLLEKAKSANVDKWQTSADNNVLYISGLSGSGKSTVSNLIGKNANGNVIRLDAYLSPMSSLSKRQLQDKEFNSFMAKKGIDYKNVIIDSTESTRSLNYKIVDDIRDAIEDFGKIQYRKNKPVVVEGVQLMDTTLSEDKGYYKNKPFVLLSTSALKSNIRSSKRDSENLLDTIELFIGRYKYYKIMSAEMKTLEDTLEFKNGVKLYERLMGGSHGYQRR